MIDMLSQKKLLQTLKWILRARWLIILGITLFLVVGRFFNFQLKIVVFDGLFPFILLGIVLGINFLLWLWFQALKRSPNIRSIYILCFSQMLVDQFFYTLTVYYSGGIETQAYIFYTLPIITSSVLFGPFLVLLFTFTTSVFYLGVIWLEYFQIIPHHYRYAYDPGFYLNHSITLINSSIIVILYFVVSFFCIFISALIRDREEAVLEERDKVSSVFKSIPDGVIMVDMNNKVILLNPAVESMLGVRVAELLGRTAGDIHKQADLKFFDQIVRHPVEFDSKAGTYGTFEFEIPEPHHIYMRIYTILVHDIHGSVVGKMKLLHDITREKTIDALKSEFISVAAHQLRTPLAAIKWVIQMVLDGDMGSISAEQKDMLQKGADSNERMIRLVNDLLNVSRIEEGRFQYNFSIGIISDLVKGVVEELQPIIKERGILFSLDFETHDLPPVVFDSSKLRLAIQNIIDNALRYTPKGGHVIVVVGYDAPKDLIFIRVSDTGVGIPKNQQNKLFNKFFRADNVVRMQTDGSGLGLFIVRNIISKHNGIVTVDSDEGKGTTFTLFLPRAKDGDKKEAFNVFVEDR